MYAARYICFYYSQKPNDTFQVEMPENSSVGYEQDLNNIVVEVQK